MDRILIAESNTELASQLRGVFADANNYPMSCDTIKKTRTMLECEEWALVLVDEKMTDGSGLDLLEYISEGIIVIMILAEDTKLNEDGLRGYGVADYIKKPFNPIVLKAKVGTQLQKKHLFKTVSLLMTFASVTSMPESSISAGRRSIPSPWCRIPMPHGRGSSSMIPLSTSAKVISIWPVCW